VPYTDSTHLKASANKGRFDKEMVAKSRAAYWDDLDATITEDRAAHGKKPLKAKDRGPVIKETKVSRTDKNAGYMVRKGKPKGWRIAIFWGSPVIAARTTARDICINANTNMTPSAMCIAAPKGRNCPMPPPTETAIVTINPTLANAATARFWPLALKRQGAKNRHSPRLGQCA